MLLSPSSGGPKVGPWGMGQLYDNPEYPTLRILLWEIEDSLTQKVWTPVAPLYSMLRRVSVLSSTVIAATWYLEPQPISKRVDECDHHCIDTNIPELKRAQIIVCVAYMIILAIFTHKKNSKSKIGRSVVQCSQTHKRLQKGEGATYSSHHNKSISRLRLILISV